MFTRQIGAVMAAGLFTSCLFAQGLQTKATKDDWEEINFEFNSSILSDGYPTLLRLAELLQQNRDFKVQVEGHTDYVGSESYNEKLALSRAGTVRDFLTKYGAGAGQVSVSGQGKRTPEVPNTTKEGRFINRRVVLTVTDGAGKIIAAGSGPQVVTALDDRLKKLEDCCNAILKKLDKLDEILAAIRDLKSENDRLKADVAALQQGANQTNRQIADMPKPLTAAQTSDIAKTEATNAANNALATAEAQRKRFTLLGVNVGPTTYSGLTLTGSGRYFAPFKENYALQVQGEYMYHGNGGASPIGTNQSQTIDQGRQEGQFDIGLVDRIHNFQAGLFSSFKYVNMSQYNNGGTLGQAALTMDYIFHRGRFGLYGTKGFRNTAVIDRAQLGPTSYTETYLSIADQVGGSALVGVWGDAYFEGNLGYIKLHGGQDSRPGGMIRLVQPFRPKLAFTIEAGLNESLVTSNDSGRLAFGLLFGNWLRPKEFQDVTHPVPVDVPRVRYQLLTRRVGNSAPVADAGPDQTGVPAGTVTLNGSASYDPDGDTLTYQWSQTSGPNVSLSGQNTATATFTAAAGQIYTFSLLVKDPGGLRSIAHTTVTVGNPNILISQFTANPTSIVPGGSSTLQWNVSGSTDITISPDVGSVSATGSKSVTPSATTTYTLIAKAGTAEQRSTVTVTVGASAPRILRFDAAPTNIMSGESSILSWTTDGAASVSISGVGSGLPASGSRSVSPTQTTTYTLTATGADGTSVSAPVIVTVGSGQASRILQFSLNPTTIDAGGSSQLCFQVENATSISISPGIGTVKASDCVTVSPSSTTTYVLTATNAQGSTTASATLTVGGVRILSFTNSPEFSTAAGNPVTLTWSTSGATSVVITGFGVPGGTLPASGSITVNPNTNVDYTLTAYGPGGQTVSSVLHVFVR